MPKNFDYYMRLPWRVAIEPEVEDDGALVYIASHPDFDGVLGSGPTPQEALADLEAARRSMIEALLAKGYPIPEPALAVSRGE